ncbi:MAG: ABC transporter permease subunit [Planctomycetaceae bacterium]
MQAIFALLSQSLQRDCRQASTALLRAVSVAAMLLVLFVIRAASQTATGLGFASYLLWMNYSGITLAGFSWFAAAIVEEREQRTLGLLRMTGVPGGAILLGKWLPRVVVVQVLLIVQIPLAVLAITMGGVTRYQLFAAYIALMAYTVMMSSIGLLWSTVCTRGRRACNLVMVCWFLHVSGPPLAKWFFSMQDVQRVVLNWTGWTCQGIIDFADTLHQMSMFRRMNSILATMGGETVFTLQVFSNLLIGLTAFGLAWFVFEYLTLYNLETPAKAPPRVSRLWRRRERKSGKRPKQAGRSWGWALAWKEFNFSCGGWTWFFTKAAFYHGLSILIISISASAGMTIQDAWDEVAGGVFITCGMAGVCIEFAGLTSRIFSSEIHLKTLQELMVLPISIAKIGYEKMFGVVLAILPALSAVVVGCLIDPSVAGYGFLGGVFSRGGLSTLMVYLAFVHLACYLCIHVRAGGLLLTFLLFWVLLAMAQGLIVFIPEDTVVTIMIVGSLLVCAVLQYRIVVDVARKGTR